MVSIASSFESGKANFEVRSGCRFLLHGCAAFRQMRQRGERLLEVRDSLSISGTRRERLGARLSKVANRLVPSLRPEGVVRQPLDLLGE